MMQFEEDSQHRSFYNPDDMSAWFDYPPLAVIGSLISGLRRQLPLIDIYGNYILKHSYIESVKTFDTPQQTFKNLIQTIINENKEIYRYMYVGGYFWTVCSSNKACIHYEYNSQDNFSFKITGRETNEIKSVVLSWEVWPSPLAVIHTVILEICEYIHRLTETIINHESFLHEKRLDHSERITLVYAIHVLHEQAELMGRVAKVGLTYRQMFLQEKICFSHENLFKTHKPET
jgi:hypothetical protein